MGLSRSLPTMQFHFPLHAVPGDVFRREELPIDLMTSPAFQLTVYRG